jgi:hypothetical protein
MGKAKQIHVAPISREHANGVCKRFHYSGTVVLGSQLHLGVFLDGRLEGVMQFGPPIDKRKLIGIVADTPWNGFLELNRMAFGPRLPRNSESRALAIAMKIIRKNYPHVQWVVSFADGTQCGDGTIYRASGFVLTAIRKNQTIMRMPDGSVEVCHNASTPKKASGSIRARGGVAMPGFQLRYIYFLDPSARGRLVGSEVGFSEIERVGAGMYRGEKRRAGSKAIVASANHAEGGGETPTPALHSSPDQSSS